MTINHYIVCKNCSYEIKFDSEDKSVVDYDRVQCPECHNDVICHNMDMRRDV